MTTTQPTQNAYPTRHTAGGLRRLATDLLVAAGVPEENAETTARILVLAEIWGIPSHGLMRLPYYLARIAGGGCRADAKLSLTGDCGAVVTYDGGAGLGHWQVWQAAETASDRCCRTGIAAVAVADSSHCGALGAYVYPMVAAGQIGLVFSNGPAVMPPWGGATPLLSTSPLAAGVPAHPSPVIVDLATSAVARGKIAALAQSGRPVPEGWALAPDGTPTTDPALALRGMLAPLGGPKGYALAFMVETLTGGLIGPLLAAQVSDMFNAEQDAQPQGISHLVLAIDPQAFGAGSADRIDELCGSALRNGGRVPGANRVSPHEVDDGHGLDVALPTLEQLSVWNQRLGLSRTDDTDGA